MPQITKSLERFSNSLEQGAYVVCDKHGNWSVKEGMERAICWLTGKESLRLERIGEAFCQALNDLEKVPTVFSDNGRIVRAQQTIYQPYVQVADRVITYLKKNSTPRVQNKIDQISQKVIALKYRIERANGGLSVISAPDSTQIAILTTFAKEWKSRQPLIVDKSLLERDLLKIQEACCYPQFADLLERNRDLRNAFFKWALRDNCDVQLFVEFPATVKRLEETHLYSRISRLGEGALAILKQERGDNQPHTSEKVVTMPFYDGKETKRYNVLDESQVVTFSGGITASIKKVFEVFVNKDYESGNFEMFKNGIMNWNYHEIGHWDEAAQAFDAVDLEQPHWWNQLPLLLTVSKEELEKNYDVKLQPGEWLTCAMGARKSPNLDLDNAHGYLKLFIPREDGSYGLYTFGKFATTFPRTLKEFLKVLVSTKKAKIVYPDENIFYFFRQHANYPIVLTPNKGRELMDLIKGDIVLGREGNLVFQFSGENCAHWVQDILIRLFPEEPTKIPNLFVMPLLKAEPGNPVLKTMFGMFKKAPKNMHPYLLNGLARALGSSSGLTIIEKGQPVFKTTYQNSHHYKGTSYQPVHLHRGIETGKFKGTLTTGY